MTKKNRDAIEDKIRMIERKSSVEYVTCFVAQSSNYASYRGLLAGFAAFFALASFRFFAFDVSVLVEFAVASLVAVLVFWVTNIPLVLSTLLPPALKQAEVLEAAHGTFLREEVFATRERTGVLVFVSELEQAVFVLADKGLRAKVKDAEWAELAQRLAQDLRRDDPGPTFLEALDSLSTRLATDFPPSADNPNELSDHMRS